MPISKYIGSTASSVREEQDEEVEGQNTP